MCEQTCRPRSPTRALGSATAPATTFNATQHSAKSVRGAPDATSLTRAPRPGKVDARSGVLEERGWSSFLSRPLNDTENAESCRAFGMAWSLRLCHGDSGVRDSRWPAGQGKGGTHRDSPRDCAGHRTGWLVSARRTSEKPAAGNTGPPGAGRPAGTPESPGRQHRWMEHSPDTELLVEARG